MKWIVISLLKVYKRFLSPWLPKACRFYPTCSEYTLMAVERHGLVKGTLLGIRRISKCHPWNSGGFDPVPQNVIKDN